MKDILTIIQIIVSFLLIASILLQTRGSSLGGVFGGGGETFQTKRGAEKFLFVSTIILSTAFLALALVNVLLY